MEKRNIDELISKYLAGEALPEEALDLEDWKELSPENLAYYTECENLFFATSPLVSISDERQKEAFETVKKQINYTEKQTPVIPIRRYYRIAVAASILLITGVAIVLSYFNNNAPAVTYTAQATEKKVVLEDKSSVVIAANSTLTVSEGFGKTNRLVKLKGSAEFEVTHTEELPLIIDADRIYIKDIGTKFKITTSYNSDTVNVKVTEGIVFLYDSANVAVTLNAGQEATYIKSLKQIIEPKVAETVIHLAFTRQSLKDVTQKLSTAYNTPIMLENSGVENCQLTVKFSGEDLETVLDIITETLGLTYIKTADGYIIKGVHCNN
jgi:transmembrane sensor